MEKHVYAVGQCRRFHAPAIESVQPVIRDITDYPELNKEYKSWTSERTKFSAALNLGDVLVNEQKWQKNYLGGKSHSGRSVADENHRVKRTLKEPITEAELKASETSQD